MADPQVVIEALEQAQGALIECRNVLQLWRWSRQNTLVDGATLSRTQFVDSLTVAQAKIQVILDELAVP